MHFPSPPNTNVNFRNNIKIAVVVGLKVRHQGLISDPYLNSSKILVPCVNKILINYIILIVIFSLYYFFYYIEYKIQNKS